MFSHSFTVRAFRPACLLALLSSLLPALALAASSIPAVLLNAPEAVRPLLTRHFKVPEQLLRSRAERDLFVRRAQQEIPALLQTEGYFSAQVRVLGVQPSGTIELAVEPGVRTQVAAAVIEFRGDLNGVGEERAQRRARLLAGWLLPVGSPFTSAAWEEAKTALLAEVAARDYAAARIVESAAHVQPEAARAELRVVVDSGPRYVFGPVSIGGLERYTPEMVLRYATFQAGEPYRRGALLDWQRSLQSLAQFSSVVARLDTERAEGEEVKRAPVRLEVNEALSRKVGVGLGYSSNHGWRSELNYTSYNFLDRAWSLTGAVALEQNRQGVTAGVDTLPNPQGFRVQWAGLAERTRVQGLETRRDKLSVARSQGRGFIENSLRLNWQQEQRLPEGGVRENDQALVLDWQWGRRTVDNPLFPMRGELTEFRFGIAGRAFFSDQDFTRSYLRHQSWIPLSERDVLTLRVEGGYTAAKSRLGIPQEYLFRVGGTQTVRGFPYQSLGFREGSAIVGGRAMLTASVEYTHWFNDWGLAAFSDAGDAADTAPTLQLKSSVGAGLRWRSPLGPLALDLARGKGQPQSLVHFSIAVAF